MRSIFILPFLLSSCLYSSNDTIQKRTKQQIGIYRLDLNKTDLGAYSKDSTYYSKLTLFMNNNSVFHFNMRVPFIEDSTGKWYMGSGSFEEWNYIHYRKRNSSEPGFIMQFGDMEPDSTFAIVENQLNPKNRNSIYRYFKKIK